MNIEQAITAYIKMRDAIAVEKRKFDEFKGGLEDKMSKIETYLMAKLEEAGADNITKKGIGVAMKVPKDYVNIKDNEKFRMFLARKMLLNLQPHMYKNTDGKFRDDGQEVLNEHAQKILNSGAFELCTVGAHKNNCKQYMADHEGLMPEGVGYEKEVVIQVRKK